MALRVGLLDPSTSHARAYSQVLREMDDLVLETIVDTEFTRCPSHVEQFAAEFGYGLETDFEALLGCDAVLALGVDWNARLGKAERLVEQGVCVFVDKPIAASSEQVKRFDPARMIGGSALPYLPQLRRFRGLGSLTVRGRLDDYYHGIHAMELLASLITENNVEDASANAHAFGLQGVTVTRISEGLMIRDADGTQHWMLEDSTWSVSCGADCITLDVQDAYRQAMTSFFQMASQQNVPRNPGVYHESALRLWLSAVQARAEGTPVALDSLDPKECIRSEDFVASYREHHFFEPL